MLTYQGAELENKLKECTTTHFLISVIKKNYKIILMWKVINIGNTEEETPTVTTKGEELSKTQSINQIKCLEKV